MISFIYRLNTQIKLFVFSFLFLLFPHISLSQELVVKLEKKTGHGFQNSIRGFHKLDPPFLQKIKFIPPDGQDFSLYYTTLLSDEVHSSYLKDSILLILYTDEKGDRNVIIDEDYDFNFNNNVVYKFNPGVTNYPIVYLGKRRIVNQDTVTEHLPFELRAFDNRSFVRNKIQELTLTEQWYKRGKTHFDNQDYFFWLKESELQSDNKRKIYVDYSPHEDGAKHRYLLEEIIPHDGNKSLKMELIDDDRLKITLIDTVDYGEMPDFTKEDIITGETLQLQDFEGQYVLLDFWGSWCVPCIEGIPDLKNTAEKFKNKLAVISIAFDRSADVPKLKKIIKENEMNWHQILQSSELDDKNSLIRLLNISIYPTFIILDRDQQIVLRKSGNSSLKEINDFLEDVIE